MDLFLLVFLLIAAVWTVMAARLLASVIGFAVTSAILTILIFRLNAPLAGVFELSVGAGLIPVLFVATIGLTQRLTREKLQARRTDHLRKFSYLPLVLAVLAVLVLALSRLYLPVNVAQPQPGVETDPRVVLWNLRHMDILGQILLLLAGAFGVVQLFKEKKG